MPEAKKKTAPKKDTEKEPSRGIRLADIEDDEPKKSDGSSRGVRSYPDE